MSERFVNHIMVAEDEESMRQALVFILEGAGYEVTAVADGAFALRELALTAGPESGYDMLITDLQMPNMLGTDLIAMLARRNIAMPVIVISGYSDKKTMIELIRNGCNDFLEKPFTPGSVLERVAEVGRKWHETKQKQQEKERKLQAQLEDLTMLLGSYEKRFSTLLNPVTTPEISTNPSANKDAPSSAVKSGDAAENATSVKLKSEETIIREYRQENWIVLTPLPQLNDDNAGVLCQEIAKHLDEGRRFFRFDLSALVDVGAKILAVFAALAAQLKSAGGEHGLEISVCSGEIARLFQLTELNHAYALPA